jgi:hypothetical protein
VNTSKPAKRILFLGTGAWPHKVGKTLLEQDLIQEPVFVSAREFAAQPQADLSNYDLIWIATTPQLQLSALNQMGNFSGKIMLEKPLGLNKGEFNEIVEAIKTRKSSIFLSQPWSFKSNEELNRLMSDPQKIKKIEIIRSGDVKRDYMAAWIDWAPHDLYLLAKYLPYQLVDFAFYEAPNSSDGSLRRLNISLTSGLHISLSAGFSPERRSEWNLEMASGEIQNLDLLSAKNSLQENSFDSIGSMLDNCFSTESNPTLINQLDWQELAVNE